jgi:thioredoxin reductase (NADPH)
MESEEKFKGRGVSACATCDGFFYKGQEVVVVGGGNTAVEEAIFLSNIADHVTVVHRGDHFTAEQILVDELMARAKPGKVKILFESEIHNILGDNIGVIGVQIKGKDGKITALSVHGIFIAIGHTPNTKIFEGQLDMSYGYINVAGGSSMATQTNVEGVFAAGDVADHHYRQAVTSAGTGCMAALDARDFFDKK